VVQNRGKSQSLTRITIEVDEDGVMGDMVVTYAAVMAQDVEETLM
jgi:hypothetical protein